MNHYDQQNFNAPTTAPMVMDAPSLQSMLDTSSALLAQAEALMSACRAMVEHTRQTVGPFAGVHDFGSGTIVAPARTAMPAAEPSRPQLLNVDLFEIFRRHFPDLQRGGATVLVALISNAGRIIDRNEMRAILDTMSDASVKVHISKLRGALKKKKLNIRISCVRGSYGMAQDGAEKLLSSIEFTPAEMKRLQQMVPHMYGKDAH
ncbi:MAG: helix-turn-helix domain-containing protein [Sphingomonadales bacterium]|jgi:hypothetical protein